MLEGAYNFVRTAGVSLGNGTRMPVRHPCAPPTVRDDADVTDSGNDSSGSAATGERSGGARRPGMTLRLAVLGVSLLVLVTSGTLWSLVNRLEGNIDTDVDTAQELERYAAERPPPAEGRAQNILLLGTDNRGDGNGSYGRDSGSQRADTAILLHISGDRSRATGVSLPRDLMVDVPACGGAQARFAQFNSAFQQGGAACTIRTVESLTDLRVDHHLVVDFRGFTKLVDAVGGVEVCLPRAVRDRQADLDLPAGRRTLGGADALGYVRARHGLGDGSDTGRMNRQQVFLGSLVKKLRSNGVLLNPAKLFPVLDAATSSLTADSGLDSLTELYELVRSVRNIPEGDVRFLTVPRRSYELDINRDELVQPQANKLFAGLRNDSALQVTRHTPDIADGESPGNATGRAGSGSSPDQAANPQDTAGGDGEESSVPTYPGTTAARDICTSNPAENGGN